MNDKVLRYQNEADCEPLHYTACGLDDVYLVSGYEYAKTPFGEGVIVKDVDGLHRAIGRHLVCDKKALNGRELRFLRTGMDMTQAALGELLSVSAQSVARWEKGECEPHGSSEAVVRLLYLEHIGMLPEEVKRFLKEFATMEAHPWARQIFANTDEEWRQQAA